MKHFLVLGFSTLLFVVFPYLLYRHIGLITSTATYRTGLGSPLDSIHLINYFFMLVNFGTIADYLHPISSFLATVVFIYALGFGLWFARISYGKKEQVKTLCIILASLWFICAGLIPFAIAGYSATERAYSAAIFGLAPLIVLSLTSATSKVAKATSWLALLCVSILGIGQFFFISELQTSTEVEQGSFFLGMTQVLPSIKSDTVLIFIDYPQSNNGCGPSFEMLYNRTDIRCAFFSSLQPDYYATRYSDHIHANRGGNLWTENWILIKINESGMPEIVPEIKEDDFGLIIYWNSKEPIRTDFRRVENDHQFPPSDMVLNLRERQKNLLSK